jgi:hypothetical protein
MGTLWVVIWVHYDMICLNVCDLIHIGEMRRYVDAPDVYSISPLHLVAAAGHMRAAKLLLRSGARIDGVADRVTIRPPAMARRSQPSVYEGCTPLHIAAARADFRMARVMLRAHVSSLLIPYLPLHVPSLPLFPCSLFWRFSASLAGLQNHLPKLVCDDNDREKEHSHRPALFLTFPCTTPASLAMPASLGLPLFLGRGTLLLCCSSAVAGNHRLKGCRVVEGVGRWPMQQAWDPSSMGVNALQGLCLRNQRHAVFGKHLKRSCGTHTLPHLVWHLLAGD